MDPSIFTRLSLQRQSTFPTAYRTYNACIYVYVPSAELAYIRPHSAATGT